MAILDINWKPSEKDLRQFAAIWFPLACLALGWLAWRWTGSLTVVAIPVVFGCILAPIAYCIPAVARGLFVGWMTVAFPIGWTISHLLMAFIYFLLITPMGLVMRLFGRDSMGRRFDETKESYWVPHQPPKDNQQYFRQY
ncbi:MAG: hypothetical protein JWM11_132 [Planctomycetaceae bacterium]|nr:hypothetical protein [Planctomycetaceae bacterium]